MVDRNVDVVILNRHIGMASGKDEVTIGVSNRYVVQFYDFRADEDLQILKDTDCLIFDDDRGIVYSLNDDRTIPYRWDIITFMACHSRGRITPVREYKDEDLK